MTTDDDVRSALALLARRADALPAPERVPAVRRRARRAALARTAVLAVAAASVVALGGTLVGNPGILRGSGPASGPVDVTPTDSTPHLDVELSQETDPVILAAALRGREGTGEQVVVLRVAVTGVMPAVEGGGDPFGLHYDDGVNASGGSGDQTCPPGSPLQTVDKAESLTIVYGPGQKPREITVTITPCPPVAAVTRTFTPDLATAPSTSSSPTS